MSEYQREVQILSQCDENYVVKYYKSGIKKDQFYIQMELCDNNLKNIIQQKRKCFGRTESEPMTTTECFISSNLMKEILECVQYLHQMDPPIIHRDLKPQNILVNYQPKNGRFLKICDFSISTYGSDITRSHTRGVGTKNYMAPEVIGFEINKLSVKYNTKADIYSLGKIFSELIDFDINSSNKNKLGNLIETMIILEYKNRPDCKYLLNELLKINTSIYLKTKNQTDMFKINEFKNQFFLNYLKQKLAEYNKLDIKDEKRIEFIDKTYFDESTTETIEEMTFDSNDSSDEENTEINDTDNKEKELEKELEKQSFDEILEKMFPNFLKDNYNFIIIEENVFIVTNEDKVSAFGSNELGKCGFGHNNRVDTPKEIPELNGKQIKQFFIGGEFFLGLNGNNHVFGWGSNSYGQLGRGYTSGFGEYLKPSLIPDLENIIEISCGECHSLALNEQGNVFSWGWNPVGQVGCGEESGWYITRPVQLKKLPKIKSIHCFHVRSFAVTFDGLVYSWGYNREHCLGHKSQEEGIFKPELICGLNNVISVGSSEKNTYFLTNEGNIYFCGKSEDSPEDEYQIIPKILETDLKFQSIKTIDSILLALSEETVYCLERNSIKKTKYKTAFEYNSNKRQNILEKLKLNLLKSFERYEKQCELGSGGCGTIIKAKDKLSGNVYALKKTNDYNEEMKKEAEMLSKCNNKFVVECYDYWVQEKELFLKMELCSNNLDNIIEEKGKCFERQSTEEMTITEYFICSQIMKEILECVQYLHQMKPPIIHRDLKPQNILVNYEPRKRRFLKLADFGLATFGSDLTISHTRWKGTPEYTAPEVWNGEIGSSFMKAKYSTKADVYSLGKILCELFGGLDINSFEIKNNELSHKWNELVKLTKNMLDNKYQNRPSCKDILTSHHLWPIKKITEKDINSEKYRMSFKQMEEFENKFFINYFIEKQKSE